MFQPVKSGSIAIVAVENDVLLFCETMLAENFELALFLGCDLNSNFSKFYNYSCVFLDVSSAKAMKLGWRGKSFFENLSGRIFVLTPQESLSEFYSEFSDIAKMIPYPFTEAKIFSVLNAEKKNQNRFDYDLEKQNRQEKSFKIVEFNRLIGKSEKLNSIKEKILLVADTDMPLIFLGESGTGKTITAQIVHQLSRRKTKPFVHAMMGNSNKDLVESKLFGNVRGAFTDAKERDGLFRKADGGTLFMDEIADLSLEAQSKILRVMESGVFRPVGSDEEIKVDVRLIFATNVNLEQMVRCGNFREDLYWRIAGFTIQVPALRERAEDIPDLVERNLNELKTIFNCDFKITTAAMKKLCSGKWPGNFRQFKSCMRRAALLSRYTGVIDHDAIVF